jgi:hypothetical protein
MIISPGTSMGWRLHYMYVKKTFLNGEIEEEVYNKYLDGFMIHEKEPYWHRGRPKFQHLTMHKKNPEYRPFSETTAKHVNSHLR